jgi:nucleotide-binding universal stress UspA family protein
MPDAFPYSRILIPYDGSPAAKQALEWAASLVRAGKEAVENLTLLRVIGGGYLVRHLHNVDLRVTRMDDVAAWRRVRQHHLESEVMPLLEEGKRLLLEKGVTAPVATQVAEGRIGEEIVRVAAAGQYRAIVMGRRGVSAVQEVLVGSVTRQVLSLARNLTVFVAGPETVFNAACPVSPLLLPVDGSDTSLAAVRQGAALAQSCRDGRPQLTLLHVLDFARVGSSLDAGATLLVDEAEDILAAGRQILEVAGLKGAFTDKLLIGEPSRTIAAEAEAGRYALVLMGARGLSPLKQLILGSVSHDVLHRIKRPVLGVVYL